MSVLAVRRSTLRALGALVAFATTALQAQAPRLTEAQLREDAAQLRVLMLETEKSWTPMTRAVVIARLDSLDRAIGTLSPVQFDLAVARIVATADNGHTVSPPTRRAGRANRVGLRITPLDSDFVVMRARPAHADLLGSRVLAVNGRPVSELRSLAHALQGGTVEWRDRSVPFLLESPEQLHALGAAAESGTATYRVERFDGRVVERVIAAEAADSTAPRVGTARWLAGEPVNDTSEWRIVRAPTQLPWSLQEPTAPFRLREVPEADAVVVELRQNSNSPQKPIREFLSDAGAMIARVQPQNIVLDMRLNGGGDLNTTRDFMKELPNLVRGRIYVLTSPYTFSAAISSVAYLKQAAPARVTIVGEQVGDRLDFFSEGRPATLRHSGLIIGLSAERHDYMNGCRAYTDCHGPVVRNPIAVPTLAPDIRAPWTREAYLEGRDPGMEAVLRHVGRMR